MAKSYTDTFIKRPVFATVLALIIILVGVASYFNLPVRQYPKIDTSVVTVSTSFSGASAKLMEGFITTPLEAAIANVDGIDYMSSQSTQGSSQITVYFKLGYNINAAVADVSDAVSSARYKLPQGINDPVITKEDPNAQPTMYIAFTDKNMTMPGVVDYLQRVVVPELDSIDGVGEAKIFGNLQYAMRIWLNPLQMAAHGITASDVENALLSNNLQSPTGQLESEYSQLNIASSTDLNTAQQFNDLVVKTVNGKLIRIKNIGQAELGSTEPTASMFMNGEHSQVIGVIPRSDANPLLMATQVRAALKTIRYPSGFHYDIAWDTSKFISASIDEVTHTILEASILVIIVIFLFLGSLRTVLIPMITIPLSLIGVCALMYAADFTINTMTLLAMVLAIGMVVDDAIVVLENIHRHIESGMKPIAAAIIGAREIRFAVIAMTLTLAAVYAPIGFLSGLTGALFKEFAFTLASAVIISGFIALTISPMMCSKIFKNRETESKFEKLTVHLSERLAAAYQIALRAFLKIRYVTLVIVIAVLGLCAWLYASTPGELAPDEDMGAIMTIVSAPASANLAYTEKYSKELVPIYKSYPEMVRYGIINGIPYGVNSAISFMVLKPWNERKRTVNQIIPTMFPKTLAIPGVRAFPVNPFRLPGSSGFMPIQFVLKTTGSYQELDKVMNELLADARKNPKLVNVDSNLKFDNPEINIEINRNKAGILGIPMSAIGDTLNIDFGQPTVGRFEINGRGFDVIPQVASQFRNRMSNLQDLYLRTATGELVPTSNLVKITETAIPQSLNHFQQLRSATLTASTAVGYTTGQALDYLENVAKKIMPSNMSYDFSGPSRQYIQAQGKMMWLFLFAIIFIFLVLAAQFESFRDPLIVMFSVPLSTFGALTALKLIGGTMNIYTEIGIVTLVGLISKHGILMVEFANQLQEEKNLSIVESIIQAASIRLRPILMTTASMIFGVIPLALAVGAGAIARQQIGWSIIGGMLIGTCMTLFVVPTMYTLLATKKKHFTTGDAALDQSIE